jgi:large subunit ribosomal protein L24
MVKIISGKDKGKVGEITKIIKNENRVVVKEINIKRKHVKPRKEGDVGKISQFEAPIHSSNVMLYNQDKQLASRVGYKVDESGNKVRVFKKLLSTN